MVSLDDNIQRHGVHILVPNLKKNWSDSKIVIGYLHSSSSYGHKDNILSYLPSYGTDLLWQLCIVSDFWGVFFKICVLYISVTDIPVNLP